MASLRKRGKYWYISYYAHKTDNAKKTTTVKGYTDKSLTQKLANKLEDEAHARRKGYTDPHAEAAKVQRALPITKHLDNYEIHLRAKGCTENHINYTRKDIQRLIDHSGVTQAGAIERGMVDRWVLSLTKDAPKTVNRRISSVQQFLKHLHGIGGVSHYVLYRYPKRPTKGLESKVHRPLTADEVSEVDHDDLIALHLRGSFGYLGQCMGGFEGGENAFELGNLLEGGKRLGVVDADVFDPAGILPVGMLRADTRIIEACRTGVDIGGLAVFILQDIAERTVKHARPTGREGGGVLTERGPAATSFDTDHPDGDVIGEGGENTGGV